MPGPNPHTPTPWRAVHVTSAFDPHHADYSRVVAEDGTEVCRCHGWNHRSDAEFIAQAANERSVE